MSVESGEPQESLAVNSLAATLAADLSAALDPCELARRVGIEPDPWQAKLLRSDSKRNLVNCSRQSGKSLTAALLCAHVALYSPGSLTLLVSPSERQSGELFKRVRGIFRELSWPCPATTESALRLELANGSRVVSLPGKEGTVRGFSAPALIVLDEASRIPDELYVALRPMLAVSGGRIVACSTPFGQRGFWWEAWRGREDWERVKVPASQCPRISAEFLAEERASMSHFQYLAEYCCSFEAASGAVFDLAAIEKCFDDSIKPLGILDQKIWGH